MNGLVITHDQQAATTSLKVAEIFHKEHRNVLASIGGLLKNQQTQRMFVEGTFENEQNGQSYPMYYMNRDGFTLLAMGFTGSKAMAFKLQYIDAFNEMERRIRFGGFDVPIDYSSALRLAADQAEQISKMQPKVDYFDTQMHNPGLMTTTVIAKRFGKSAVWLNRWLESHGMIYRQGKSWVVRQKFSEEGYADYENWSDADNSHIHPLLKWTQKGQKFIYDCLAKEGIQPVMVTMRLDPKEAR